MTDLQPSSGYFASDSLQIHYVTWGNARNPPLLLLHGGMDHCRNWDWLATELVNEYQIFAMDLRGHGDSDWSANRDYSLFAYVSDFVRFVEQVSTSPVKIIAHSLGGNIALRYSGLFPDMVDRLVAIEGLGPAPKIISEREKIGYPQRIREWLDTKRDLENRRPKRYATIEGAVQRMQSANPFLTPVQARHLVNHGVKRNADHSWSWKYDNWVRSSTPVDVPQSTLENLWNAINCPVLLAYGANSWASNPAIDGRSRHFRHGQVELFDDAGHWVHHEQFDKFVEVVKSFLK